MWWTLPLLVQHCIWMWYRAPKGKSSQMESSPWSDHLGSQVELVKTSNLARCKQYKNVELVIVLWRVYIIHIYIYTYNWLAIAPNQNKLKSVLLTFPDRHYWFICLFKISGSTPILQGTFVWIWFITSPFKQRILQYIGRILSILFFNVSSSISSTCSVRMLQCIAGVLDPKSGRLSLNH